MKNKQRQGNHFNVKGKPLTRQKISIQHNKQLCISLLKVQRQYPQFLFRIITQCSKLKVNIKYQHLYKVAVKIIKQDKGNV